MEKRRLEMATKDYDHIVDGVKYRLISTGGSGWSIGIGSVLQAIDGPNSGKFYLANIGHGVKILEELSPEEAAQKTKENKRMKSFR